MSNLDTASIIETENTPQFIDTAKTNQDVVIEQPVVDESTPDTQNDEITKQGDTDNEDDLPKGIQKRFAKMTREKYTLQKELAELRNQVQGLSKKPETEYKREDFGSDEEAYIQYKVEQQLNKQLQANANKYQESQKAEAEQSKFLNIWQSKIDSYKEELPNYKKVVDSASIDFTEDEVTIIMESPVGPKIAYALASDEKLAEQFESLPSARARDRFLTKLEIQLESAPAKSKQAVSKAPAPTPKISTGGGVASNLETMSMDDFVAMRAKARSNR